MRIPSNVNISAMLLAPHLNAIERSAMVIRIAHEDVRYSTGRALSCCVILTY